MPEITHSKLILPLRKMPVFQGVAPLHTIFTSSCVIFLWDSATANLPFGKELNPSSQEDAHFSGHCTSAYNFHFILRQLSLGLSKSSLTPWKRAQSFLSGRIIFLRAYCFVNALTLSFLGFLWFSTHPYYYLNPYVNLYYLWSISIANDRRYPKYFILCVENSRFAEKCSPILWWSQPNKVAFSFLLFFLAKH